MTMSASALEMKASQLDCYEMIPEFDYEIESVRVKWFKALDSFMELKEICLKYSKSNPDPCNGVINYSVVMSQARDGLTEESNFDDKIKWILRVAKSQSSSSSGSSDGAVPVPPTDSCYFVVDAKETEVWVKRRLKYWKSSVMLQLRNDEHTFTLLVEWDDYFYVRPSSTETLEELRISILDAVRACEEENYRKSKMPVEMTVVSDKRTMYGYDPEAHDMIRVTTPGAWASRKLFRILSGKDPSRQFFEATKPCFLTKFMAHNNLSGCCAVRVENGRIERIGNSNFFRTGGKVVRVDDDKNLYVPRVMMMDAEMCSQEVGKFPEADTCPVIAISWVFCIGNEPQAKGVLGLHHVDDDCDGAFQCFETEIELFVAYAKLLREFAVEVVMGFNSNKFDNRYFIDRCAAIGAGPRALAWGPLGADAPATYSVMNMHTNQAGDRELLTLKCFGVTFFDIFQVIMADVTKSLRSYSLRSVCDEFLPNGFNKLEMRYSEIPKLFKTPEGRYKLFEYALRDVEVLVELDRVLMYGSQNVELTKILGCTLEQTMNRGVTFKLSRKLMEYTIRENFLIPSFVERPVKTGKFMGALVLNPVKGMHECCTPVFDFASLYPSCMISGNVSWDSHLPKDPEGDAAMGLRPDDVIVAPNGERFVKHEVHFGLVAKIEEELFLERGRLKKLKAAAPPGSVERAVRDGQQLGVKLVMNSLYGYLGAETTAVPNVVLASTVTAWGREMLMEAKRWFEGPDGPKPSEVSYGDTDSVFIRLPNFGVDPDSVARCFDFCEQIERKINKDVFSKYRRQYLEFEKVLCNLILVERKKYTSLKVEGRNKTTGLPNQGKLSTSGLELVRRDNCPLCQTVVSAFITNTVVKGDRSAAVREVKEIVTRLFRDELPLSDFVISKKIAKMEYKSEPGHVTAWRRQRERFGTALACEVGERFEYIVRFTGVRGHTPGDKMVDLMTAEEDGLKPDHDYYFDTFVKQPLERVAVHVLSTKQMKEMLDKNAYEHRNTVRANKNNLLSHFGLESVTTVKKQK